MITLKEGAMALWSWWKSGPGRRLWQFFIFPLRALACLFFGHVPVAFQPNAAPEGDDPGLRLAHWSWPIGGTDGFTAGDRHVTPGVHVFVCLRCRQVYALPGEVAYRPPLSNRDLRQMDKARRRARR